METTHTKGEWAWQLFGDTYMLAAQHGKREIIIGAINAPVFNYPVPAMSNKGLLKVVDKDHPNAKLIAAAPDLLESEQDNLKALQDIIKCLPAENNMDYDPGDIIMRITEIVTRRLNPTVSAIKKATT